MEQGRVRRRRVFYIPGYDPIPPRRYRELYRREARAQAAVSGYDLALVPGSGTPHGWSVAARMDGRESRAEIGVLVWSDIVRASMSDGIAATYWQLLRTAWIYLASGALRRLMRLRKGPVLAALYPVAMLLAQLALAVLLGWGAAAALNLWLPAGLGWIAAPVAAYLALRWFKARDGRVFAHYLMHDYAFSARHGGAYPPELEARLRGFADAVADALDQDWDEVLVVGHSSGAYLGVSVLADLLRAGRARRDGPALAFLSLGQVVPMVSFLPRADRLRADLHLLAQSDALTWIDVTAPGDGCAFALCDPVAVTGVAPPEQRWPLVVSAAFSQTLRPETWRALRWRFFRLHFQYMCAFDRPGDYDYFRITAGPRTLAARYADRPASRSCLRRPVSGHRGMAA